MNLDTIEYANQEYNIIVGITQESTDFGKVLQVKIPDIFVESESALTFDVNQGNVDVSQAYLEGTPFSNDFQWKGGYWVYNVKLIESIGYSELVINTRAPKYPADSTLKDMGISDGFLPISVLEGDSSIAMYNQIDN
ncbi:MAG: hypothetical protein RR470_11885 [Vagococcus sp.]|uniref:hypothetical protein n=1 Tax=Vagococcus sp. TaxID=1933889 RepID=UPI002FCB2833